MSLPTLPGISAQTVTTARLTSRVLCYGPDEDSPVLFLHGNLSSATWWEEVMRSLPSGIRGIAPDQRGFGQADPSQKIDATRGLGDWADDAIALLDQLAIAQAHLVGCSAGGSAIWRLLIDYPDRFLSATLVDPGSPYGFGGTKDVQGTACYADFAGSGAGLVNPQLIQRVREGDRSLDSPFSPRQVMRTLLFKPPFIAKREDVLLSALLAMHLGEQDLPGDFVTSPHWPYVAPGQWGLANALSPKYAGDVSQLYAAEPKLKLLWLHGSDDVMVSNYAASDPATVGKAGLLPNWPGPEIYPPQPMVDQTRAVLDRYATAGGSYQEVVVQDAGHMPYLEKLAEFNAAFHQHLKTTHT